MVDQQIDTSRTKAAKEELAQARKLLMKKIKNRQLKEVNLTNMGPFSSRDFKKLVSAVRDQQKPKAPGTKQ